MTAGSKCPVCNSIEPNRFSPSGWPIDRQHVPAQLLRLLPAQSPATRANGNEKRIGGRLAMRRFYRNKVTMRGPGRPNSSNLHEDMRGHSSAGLAHKLPTTIMTEPSTMSVTFRKLQPVFAAEATGVDCRAPLSKRTSPSIEAGMDEYADGCFRQHLTDQERGRFTRHFGEQGVQHAGHIRKQTDSDWAPAWRIFKSRQIRQHHVGSGWSGSSTGDRLWHSDSSFRPVPAKYSCCLADHSYLGRQYRVR